MLNPCNPDFIIPKPGTPMVTIAAAVLVDSDGRIAIAKRPEGKAMAGMWEFPGGKLEAGEIPETCLVRELQEELGIETHPSCFRALTFTTHSYESFYLTLLLYVCRKWDGIPMGREGQQVKWVYVRDLGNYSMPEANQPLLAILGDLL